MEEKDVNRTWGSEKLSVVDITTWHGEVYIEFLWLGGYWQRRLEVSQRPLALPIARRIEEEAKTEAEAEKIFTEMVPSC